MIEIRNVSKNFGLTEVLQNINLEVRQGEFVTFVGPSGCGKTTLLRIIAGLEEVSSGEVRVNGDSPSQAIRHRRLGFVFQEPSLIPSKNALENIALTQKIARSRNGLAPKDLLERFGVGDAGDKYPHQLSGGMKQRVNIATAIAHNPQILLLDEPFRALDAITRNGMCVWLTEIVHNLKKTAAFVTHDVSEAVLLSDRVLVFSPKPARIVKEVIVDFPTPRKLAIRKEPKFHSYTVEILDSLESEMKGEW